MCVKCDLGHPEACDSAPRTYPPQCITCSRFVNVKTARPIADTGDYGHVYGYEFECARCVVAEARR